MKKIIPPKQLKEIPDSPESLYVRGDLPECPCITIVGARKYTEYGKYACEKIIGDLKGQNIAIVSGLALGIDGIAHLAAINNNLQTIAVLPSGLNDEAIYPKTNLKLAYDILKHGGALVSEFEPNAKPEMDSFASRNRIMAAISPITLIIECEERSGTRITARLATEYNKEVCVIPHPIHTNTGKGANALLKQGAHCVTSGDDLLELLGIEEKKEKGKDLTKQEKDLLKHLKEPKTKDELKDLTKAKEHILQSTLATLSVKGCIKETKGKIVALTQ